MTDIFPIIEHLDEVLAAIDGREEFFVHRNHELGFVSVLYRYVMADTFPDPGETGIDPHEVGAARWCASVAARRSMPATAR